MQLFSYQVEEKEHNIQQASDFHYVSEIKLQELDYHFHV